MPWAAIVHKRITPRHMQSIVLHDNRGDGVTTAFNARCNQATESFSISRYGVQQCNMLHQLDHPIFACLLVICHCCIFFGGVSCLSFCLFTLHTSMLGVQRCPSFAGLRCTPRKQERVRCNCTAAKCFAVWAESIAEQCQALTYHDTFMLQRKPSGCVHYGSC